MPTIYEAGLRPEDIDDFVELTLNDFEKDKWTDISTTLQKYFAMNGFMLGDRVAKSGGEALQWQVKVRNTGNARNTGMYAIDDVQVQDVMKSVQVPWTKQTTNMAYDIDEPGLQSGDMTRILDIIQPRRHAAITDLADLMEANLWECPANDSEVAEQRKPRGLTYWIVRNATAGFNGGTPINTSFTDVAGLSPTTYPTWRNYTDQYTSMSRRDMIRKMRTAVKKCKFTQPVKHPDAAASGIRYNICTTLEVQTVMEESLEEQNQNLGNDIASKDDMVVFRKAPVHWIPYFEDAHDTTGADSNNRFGKNPIFGIDKSCFQMVVKRGAYMRRSKIMTSPNQHTVRHIHWDSWTQFRCLDRRRNFVITQSA